ncbi:unnamed protein product [Caenorhabditis angaria]|uniref:Uncharacterized protein n=1 Tax=Caenorhabditis angaria TaxID=860376 RepID=A0A9P1IS07_9PELO|nr:unnamed protein product [Caenorhabditis angaria]
MQINWSAIVLSVIFALFVGVQKSAAMPSPQQVSLSPTRNCFFSPMGCVFLPKMTRIRKLSQDYRYIAPEYE